MDFRSAGEARLHGLSDQAVLALAARDGRVLVSHDFRTMPHEFARFLQRFAEHGIRLETVTERVVVSPGIFIVPQKMPLGVAIESLQMIWAASDAAEWYDRVVRLPL
jgi:hypothetical protein